MTLLWTLISIAVAIIWVLSIVDIVRHHYPLWTSVGWIALVIVLPLLGSIIYFATRKPDPGEAERAYRRGGGS